MYNLDELTSKYKGVTANSKLVKDGYIFVAINGNNTNGEKFIKESYKNGAKLVVASRMLELPYQIEMISVENTRLALSQIAKAFYSKQPKYVAGVTGTNGKTSTAYFFYQIMGALGIKSAFVGTIGLHSSCDYTSKVELEQLTSQSADTIHKLLDDMADNIDAVSMEVSSHALDQHRMDSIDFSVVAFTNLSHDHLDYHGSFENYFTAKLRLFAEVKSQSAVVNIASEAGKKIAQAYKGRLITYGVPESDIYISNTAIHGEFQLRAFGVEYSICLNILGDFQLENLSAAYGMAIACGKSVADINNVVQYIKAPSGRMQKVISYNDADILVDYAHTPDALEKVLRSIAGRRLIVVFGCGGDRDRQKRNVMGEIAARYADVIVLTNDNPRSEDPKQILDEIASGVEDKSKLTIIEDRAMAIKHAISMLRPADVLIVAGKGHETGQTIGGVTYPFSDAECIIETCKI